MLQSQQGNCRQKMRRRPSVVVESDLSFAYSTQKVNLRSQVARSKRAVFPPVYGCLPQGKRVRDTPRLPTKQTYTTLQFRSTWPIRVDQNDKRLLARAGRNGPEWSDRRPGGRDAARPKGRAAPRQRGTTRKPQPPGWQGPVLPRGAGADRAGLGPRAGRALPARFDVAVTCRTQAYRRRGNFGARVPLARISHQVARPRSFRRRDCVATGQAGSAAVLREGQFGRRRGKSGEEPDVGSVFPAFSRVLRGVSPPECRHNRDVPPT